MLKHLPKPIRGFVKLAGAGAVVIALFWVIVSFYPSTKRGEILTVKESQADIFALSFGPATNTEKFGSALEMLGHEPPRVYRVNENAVFFSTALHHNRRPNDVLREYQEEFVRQGLNSEVHSLPVSDLAKLGTPGANQKIEAIEKAAMSGEIIPYVVDGKTLAMGGTVMDLPTGDQEGPDFEKSVDRLESNLAMFQRAYEACGGSQEILASVQGAKNEVTEVAEKIDRAATQVVSCTDGGGSCSETKNRYQVASGAMAALKEAVEQQPELRSCAMMKNAGRANVEESKDAFSERIKAFRSIEAMYDEKSNTTHVSATWSDEKFDATKFRTKSFKALDETKVAQSLPLCDGCRRTWDFGGSGKESDYSTTKIASPNSPAVVTEYYLRRLEREGWQVSEAQRATNEIMKFTGKVPNSRWLRVMRGNEHMTVRIADDGRGGSRIFATTAN